MCICQMRSRLRRDFDTQMQLLGWGMFIASALFFSVSTARNGDDIGLVGSLLFLLACFVFLVPLLRQRND